VYQDDFDKGTYVVWVLLLTGALAILYIYLK